MKVCNRCGIQRTEKQYQKDNKYKDGFSRVCKYCTSKRRLELKKPGAISLVKKKMKDGEKRQCRICKKIKEAKSFPKRVGYQCSTCAGGIKDKAAKKRCSIRWQKAHPEQKRQYNKKQVSLLSDSYVKRSMVVAGFNRDALNQNDELVQTYKSIIKFKRICKGKKQNP